MDQWLDGDRWLFRRGNILHPVLAYQVTPGTGNPERTYRAILTNGELVNCPEDGKLERRYAT